MVLQYGITPGGCGIVWLFGVLLNIMGYIMGYYGVYHGVCINFDSTKTFWASAHIL